MTRRMDIRVLRFVIVALVAVLVIGARVTASRGSKGASVEHELTPQTRAAGLTFDPGMAPGDQQWVLAAIARARPEAQQLIAVVDGLVTIGTVNLPGAPFVGAAQPGSDDIRLNIAYLDGERTQDRATAVLHELGHIIDFELVPTGQMQQLAGQVPSSGACFTADTGDCTAPEERFADTFAKWALRGAVSATGAGYGTLSPGSLESWGAPLAALAIDVEVASR